MPRRIDDDIRNEVLAHWGRHKTPKEITALMAASTAVAQSGDPPPSVRTVQRWIRDEAARRAATPTAIDDGRGSWLFDDGDARYILPMLAAVAEERGDGVDSSWVERIVTDSARRVAHEFGDMPPIELYWVATEYVAVEAEERRRRRELGESSRWVSPLRSSVDLYLGFTPWRDAGRRYAAAFWSGKLGRIRPLMTPSTSEALWARRLHQDAIAWPFDLPKVQVEDQ